MSQHLLQRLLPFYARSEAVIEPIIITESALALGTRLKGNIEKEECTYFITPVNLSIFGYDNVTSHADVHLTKLHEILHHCVIDIHQVSLK